MASSTKTHQTLSCRVPGSLEWVSVSLRLSRALRVPVSMHFYTLCYELLYCAMGIRGDEDIQRCFCCDSVNMEGRQGSWQSDQIALAKTANVCREDSGVEAGRL